MMSRVYGLSEDTKDNLKSDEEVTKDELLIKEKKKNQSLLLVIAFLLLCILIMSIVFPVMLVRQYKSNKNDGSLDNTRNITMDHPTTHNTPFYGYSISPYAKHTRVKVLEPESDKKRIFIMGDVHGCLDEMNQLLKKIQFEPSKDILILTGDLVYRGPNSAAVIHRAKELGAYCVRGNHDDKLIRLKSYELQHGVGAMSPPERIMPEGAVADPIKFNNKHLNISRNLSVEDYEYLTGCPLILDIPKLDARVVHGGIDPYVKSLEDNDPWAVMNMRTMDKDHRPLKLKLDSDLILQGTSNWTTVYQKYTELYNITTTIYYGHDASRGLVLENRTIGLDTGCVHGRKLSVIEMRTHNLTQIDCISMRNENSLHDEDDE